MSKELTKTMKALAGIQERNKKFLTNESFLNKESTLESDFITIEFDQAKVEPGEDDHLYKLK